MNLEFYFFLCCAILISSTSAEKVAVSSEQEAAPLVSISDEELADAGLISSENVITHESDAPLHESSDVQSKTHTAQTTHHTNTTQHLLTDLENLLANMTKVSNSTEHEDVETTTEYDVKHYLTAEQKYYMLRVNLLGIGIRVVHDIIPIPVINTDQYTKAMDALLDRVQLARKATSNITAEQHHNITLEDAHKIHLAMQHTGETATAKAVKAPAVSRATEVMIVIGVAVAIVLVGVMIYGCQRAIGGKGDYYDHAGGGSVPLN